MAKIWFVNLAKGIELMKDRNTINPAFSVKFSFCERKIIGCGLFPLLIDLISAIPKFPTYYVCELKWISAKGTFTLKTNILSFSKWKETQQHYNPENQRLPLKSEILYKQTDHVTWKMKIISKKMKSYSTRLLCKPQFHGRNE